MNPLRPAINKFGSRSALARELGVSGEAVRKWERTQVPAERCLQIARLTHGSVRCEDLRPDLDWAALLIPLSDTTADTDQDCAA